MSELALKLIAENKAKYARGEDARVLDLGNCGLMEVPEEVGELVWLEELKISLNELDFLKDRIYNSESNEKNILMAFLLSERIVRKVPNLPKLKKLIIKKNSAIIDLGFISNLNGLNTLICKSVVLFSLNGITNLINREHLDISNTSIQDFSILSRLTNLRVLNCSRTYLEDVSFVEKLPFLQNLYLGSTWIKDIEQLKHLKDLRRLELQYSSDVSNLTPLADLDRLREINLAYTAITDLSPLQNLLKKDIKISRKHSKNTINIRGCKVVFPPPEVVKQGNVAILNYFAERSKQQFQNTEIKLILIGNSTAGKTSLSRYLRERIYQSGQPTSHGIQNHRWQPEGRDIQVNCWDFGGQEYYHATHRLFLSRNAVYTLVWDARTDQGGIEPTEIHYENDPKPYTVQLEHFPQAWWLKNIRHYTRESNPPVPVLLVQNKCARDGESEIDKRLAEPPFSLPHKWRNNHIDLEITATEQANGESGEWTMRFKLFEQELLKTLQSQMATYEFAVYHRDIRDKVRELAAAGTTYLPYSDFEKRCRDIEPDAKMDLVEIYLRDITGDILYYSHNPRLRERVFLRPDWVCNRIYQILSRQVQAQNGVFGLEWVRETLNCDETEALDFVALMREFELVFDENDDEGKPTGSLVAPQYLPETCTKPDKLEAAKEYANLSHAFTLWFPDFLPKSHIARFVAHWGSQAKQRLFWKNGLLFQTEGCTALVERTGDKIRVELQTEQSGKRTAAMQRIFHSFLQLEEGQAGFAVSMNEKDSVWWSDVQEAIQMQAKQVKTNFSGGVVHLVDLQPFIIFQKPVMSAKKVFISYSKSDKEHLLTLKKHLKIFERQTLIEIWDDSQIHPGEEWDVAIKRELNAADIIFLLVSADLIATDYVWDVEMQQALTRHQTGQAVVIPIIIRPCAWTSAPFGKLNALPEKGVAITAWENQDDAWAQVVNRIEEVI